MTFRSNLNLVPGSIRPVACGKRRNLPSIITQSPEHPEALYFLDDRRETSRAPVAVELISRAIAADVKLPVSCRSGLALHGMGVSRSHAGIDALSCLIPPSRAHCNLGAALASKGLLADGIDPFVERLKSSLGMPRSQQSCNALLQNREHG